jgi:hypothetical protein
MVLPQRHCQYPVLGQRRKDLTSQVMTFTNMRNEEYLDDAEYNSDADSNDDSDYDSDNASSDDNDNDYEDFIAGVDNNHPAPPDPPDANVDEKYNNDYNNDDESEDADDNTSVAESEDKNDHDDENDHDDTDENDHDDTGYVPANDADEAVVVPLPLKKLTDWAGAMPPVIHS